MKIRNNLPLENNGSFIWLNLNPLQPKIPYTKVVWNCPSDSREDFFYSVYVFSQYRDYFSLKKKEGPFIWTNVNSFHTKLIFVPSWNWPTGSWKDDFSNLSMYFNYFVIISDLKSTGPLFEQTWIPFTQTCFLWYCSYIIVSQICKSVSVPKIHSPNITKL